jgi:predicted adenine nucleotide alpha hydrolase (AANH) superfamily ATPase
LAKSLGIEEFTTSIVISPHKNYEKLTKIGQDIAKNNGLIYLAENFRKQDGFLKTNQISKSLNLYRQNYCGCKFAKKI